MKRKLAKIMNWFKNKVNIRKSILQENSNNDSFGIHSVKVLVQVHYFLLENVCDYENLRIRPLKLRMTVRLRKNLRKVFQILIFY